MDATTTRGWERSFARAAKVFLLPEGSRESRLIVLEIAVFVNSEEAFVRGT